MEYAYSSEAQRVSWRGLLKIFDFIPYVITIKSSTQIMAWLFVSVGSKLLKAVPNYDD